MMLLAAFVFGAIIGSFLNVCIARIPAEESILRPASHCPRCGSPIRPWDNIPIFSYVVLLRGHCRDCQSPIAARYPLVEALTGGLFVLVVYRFGISPIVIAYLAFVAALVVVSFIDLDHQIIPDAISLPGTLVGLLLARLGYGVSLTESFDGALLGGGLLYAVAAGYEWLKGREGMGGGDIKLMAMVGSFLGWKAVLVTLIVGSLFGAIVGVAMILGRGADSNVPIPFGPFLAVGALVALLYGNQLLGWYFHLMLA